MKKLAICLLMLGMTAATMRAEADKAVLEVKYDVRQQMYIEDEQPSTDQMVLLIGERSSQFMSLTSEILALQRDSLAQAAMSQLGLPMSGMMMGGEVQMMGADGYQVFKHWPMEGMVTLVDAAGGKPYRVAEAMPDLDWTLLEGDTVIAEYDCQKAMAQWRGRTWTVWYTLDLPYSDGPWKLWGLPGLILAASDRSGEFSFECIAIKQGDSRPIELTGKTDKCSLKELQDMKTRQAKDPVGFVLESMGLGGMLGSGQVQVITLGGYDGQPATIPARTPVFMERPE